MTNTVIAHSKAYLSVIRRWGKGFFLQRSIFNGASMVYHCGNNHSSRSPHVIFNVHFQWAVPVMVNCMYSFILKSCIIFHSQVCLWLSKAMLAWACEQ